MIAEFRLMIMVCECQPLVRTPSPGSVEHSGFVLERFFGKLAGWGEASEAAYHRTSTELASLASELCDLLGRFVEARFVVIRKARMRADELQADRIQFGARFFDAIELRLQEADIRFETLEAQFFHFANRCQQQIKMRG